MYCACAFSRMRDLIKSLIGLIHFFKAFTQCLLGSGDIAVEMICPLFYIMDSVVDIYGKGFDLISQLSDLFRNNGKTASLCAGTGCFNGCVQRKDIGLISDGNDLVGTLLYFFNGFLQAGKGVFHLLKIGFYPGGTVFEFLYIVLRLRDGIRDRIFYGYKFRRYIFNAGKIAAEIQKLFMKFVRFRKYLAEGTAYFIYFDQRRHFFLYELCMVVL